MSTNPSRSEALILDALRGGDSILLEQVTERIPELSWNELFLVVDALSRRGDLILRRSGFAYYLSPHEPRIGIKECRLVRQRKESL